jgi:hypothetical protein
MAIDDILYGTIDQVNGIDENAVRKAFHRRVDIIVRKYRVIIPDMNIDEEIELRSNDEIR